MSRLQGPSDLRLSVAAIMRQGMVIESGVGVIPK